MKMTLGRAFLSLIIALSVATPAFAQTTDSSAQIETLRAQLSALQAQLDQLRVLGTQTVACPALSRSLTLGSSGRDVTSLQNYLIARGYLNARYATGYYGFLTAQAVGNMQISQGVVTSADDEAFGILGPRTRTATLRDCGGSNTTTTNTTTTTTTSTGTSGTTATSRTPTIRATVSLSQNNVAIEYTNIPASNRILFMNASTKVTYGSPNAYISGGGNGAMTIPLPTGMPSGNYFLRVVQYYSPSTIIVSSNGFFVGERTQTTTTPTSTSGGSGTTQSTAPGSPAPGSIAPDGTSFSSLPACPSNAVDKRGRNGEQFYCSCPANFTSRGIWGGGSVNRNYTDDSDICTAAAHSGQFSPANGGAVYYAIKPGASSYPSWQGANAINSSAWGSWYGSFWITGPKG